LRGWISPDDRLWRHPSESASTGPGSPALIPQEAPPGHSRAGPWAIGGATACIALVLVAAGLAMATAGSTGQSAPASTPGEVSLTGAPTTEPGMSQLANSAERAMLTTIGPSTVALSIVRLTGRSIATGLVAESGGIIVTTSRALLDARSITVIEPNGSRQAAEVIGVDQTSGLAVVRIADDLPAATFDDDDPSVGAPVMAVAMEPGPQASTPLPRAYAGTVLSSGLPLGGGAVTSGFAGTTVAAPLAADDIGCPLLDHSGNVSGILEQVTQSGASTRSVFLPAELVLGVVRQLVSSGAVDHGWLGVSGGRGDAATSAPTLTATTTSSPASPVAPSPTPDGALVSSVDSSSPAAIGGLLPGDVIVGIDGHQVHSTAELRTRLYPDPPGTALDVTYQRTGSTLTTSIVLGEVPADAPGDASSS
jgi:S1-C subfamily serine protease